MNCHFVRSGIICHAIHLYADGRPSSDPAAGGSYAPRDPAPSDRPIRTAAFFDLDKTVIAKSSTLAFSKPFFSQGPINRRAVLKSSYAQFLFLMSGADHEQMDRMRSYITNMCAGWDVEQVKAIVAETLHEIVDPLVFAEAASSSPTTSSAAATSSWSPHRARRSSLRSPAPSAPPTPWPPGWSSRTASTPGRSPSTATARARSRPSARLPTSEGYSLEHCYAYSDSITDLPMLEARRSPHGRQPGPRTAQGGDRTRVAGADVLQARVAAGPAACGPVGRRRRHDGCGRHQRVGGRRADLFAAAAVRVLTRRPSGS